MLRRGCDARRRAVSCKVSEQQTWAVRVESAETQAEAERLEAVRAAAQELAEHAAAAVAAAEGDVEVVKERLGTVRAASAEAAAGLREAGRTAVKARARAEAAARQVEKLTSS
ncbi:hypothetical protein [Streptomyces sp. NBC_01264]|uniref:hypothetical protein n=1 Tax=Streptomyces sp. NBC_01264 TaxID=2903804 RepID=UPI0022563B0D|nr:hypothetical protein [Streptomyces sp. NBC_01264]MCX4775357.1 hypothetical protein [Streptomyces sp. NBC_01264]